MTPLPAVDQLFKEVIQAFLREFRELFLPRIAAEIDFERGVIFRDKELFTDFPEGDRREADLIAEVATRSGTP